MPRIHFVKNLPAHLQAQVRTLHRAAFVNSPCTPCKGACCHHCKDTEGFLGKLPHHEKEALKQKYNFDVQTGFRTNNGCRLPFEHRSEVCVTFYCLTREVEGVSHEMNKEQVEAAVQLNQLFYFEHEPGFSLGERANLKPA